MIRLDTVDTYNKLYGLETLHPLVSVIDLTKATKVVNHVQMDYGLYALFLKGGKDCDIKYGRQSYDYQEGTIVSFAPGQVIEVDMIKDEVQPQVYGLLFHPDFIRGTSLGQEMKKYGFFSYSVHEALHLSERERAIVKDCLKKNRLRTATRHRQAQQAADRHQHRTAAKLLPAFLRAAVHHP